MAITNQERVGKAIELLRAGLAPYVARELESHHQEEATAAARRYAGDDRMLATRPFAEWDAAALLRVMWEAWNAVFRKTLGRAERSLVQELRDWRNDWAHQKAFTSDDADRALDSVARLLSAVSAPEAEEVTRMKMELRRLIFEEQVRGQKRRAGGSLIETKTTGTVKPWREVVSPHRDVASGRYQQAEFAADLWQVHLGEGTEEYRNPQEFFRRTFLTDSLSRLLVGAVERLSGGGGDPVVQLQTNFGGGKTHSMLALYHLFSGAAPGDLAGVDALLAEAGVTKLPTARRAVLVGNRISPGNPVTKADGTVVRTLWGELAWQLGGAAAFERIRADDEHATSPGDVLREILKDHGPCLILIDEWVAYARQLHDQSDLPAGSFETQFTFAQALTESAKLAGNCLLVISLPASDWAQEASPHTRSQIEDVEVGGVRGREALSRIQNVVGRVESAWRPASAEEGFEIVRRRLFEPLAGPERFKDRDVTARAFSDLYRDQASELPPECRGADYEKRIQAAYPIHPEIFDRLYSDWSTLVKFQRTRGVLRLMAAVIHSLWERGDRNPLILPSTIPIDDPRVRTELTRYLSDNWAPIIEKDVDGPSSLPLAIDNERPNLGKLSATRRVARTIYLGSAPTGGAAHRGIEDRRVKLGCVMPGEPAPIFGDALRYLAGRATYLYQDGTRYWYSTQPTVQKLAQERMDELRRDPHQADLEREKRLKKDLENRGDFARAHWIGGADVLDELEARLVVLPAEHPYSKEAGNDAEVAARAILEFRGTQPRLYQNTVVFLAADKVRLQDLDEAVLRYLAWQSIVAAGKELNLDPHQQKQAETQRDAADGAVTARLPETYQWLLVPEQPKPGGATALTAVRLTGSEPLAVRASKRLRSDETLLASMGSTILRKHLDAIPLWRSGDHVEVRQLVADFAQYLYLPRLVGPQVLLKTISDGVALLVWERDSFAYAESYDEAAGRYRGLRGGVHVTLSPEDSGLLVKPDVARHQMDAEAPPPAQAPQPGGDAAVSESGPSPLSSPGAVSEPPAPVLKRFYGTVQLDATRVGRDASRIADEVIAHLAGQVGAEVTVTLEIEARLPNGASEQLVRTVTENSRTLKLDSSAFESD